MAVAVKESTQPRLRRLYNEKIRPELKEELGLRSIMQVPVLKKIVINVGAGFAVTNPKALDSVLAELAAITGQAPVKTRAKEAISNFKLRKGLAIGAMVTLRGNRMYEFLDRLISVALPRVRDFNGLSPKAFDAHGNYTIGIREQIIFPEIHFDDVERIHGMDITLVIRSESPEHSAKLLEKFQFPLRKK
ncbi:MAG: 50S ribosomal protein L5 [Turneriella sp.]|nr:50S ribosomal protein L5 [Leptospiraceae bacterium]MCX7633435.1 50S ribosomal protein L5 [Turneriella sp.]